MEEKYSKNGVEDKSIEVIVITVEYLAIHELLVPLKSMYLSVNDSHTIRDKDYWDTNPYWF